MCGIAGVVTSGRAAVDRDRLTAMGTALAHRGPDGAGTWIAPDGRVGLTHRRLAIIDPDPRSDQPMRSADGAITLTYNGELYNHRELRAALEREGRRFRTTSDTEVLVEALAAWGDAALPRLRGMFAFAAHDARTGEVVLARDPLGIKPLHHGVTPTGDVVFASEVRALRPLVPGGLDPEGAIDLLLWGSIAAPRTSVRGVRALPAGSLLRLHGGRMTEERWAAPPVWRDVDDGRATPEALVEAVRDSVRAHLVADVPVAVFLSSGVDSGVVAAIAAAAGPITALTVRDPDSDEVEAAAARARRLGIPHVVVDVRTDDAVALASAVLDANDQPSLDGVNSFVVARAAAEAGFRVALSGVGGDELFGGYPTAGLLPRLARAQRALAPLGGLPATLASRPTARGWDRSRSVARPRWVLAEGGRPQGPYRVARGVFAPSEVAVLLGVDVAEVRRVAAARLATIPVRPSHPAHPSAAEFDQYLRHQLLRDIDATSMASSVEVRTPLVDSMLLDVAAACPQWLRAAGPAKAVLRAAAPGGLPAPSARKQGFSVPMARWIRTGALPLETGGGGGAAGRLADRVVAAARSGRAHWSRAWLLHVLAHERQGRPTHG